MSADLKKNERRKQQQERLAAIDTHVGARIRLRRNSAGMPASAMANVLRTRYQQVHFYETGKNKVSAGNLYLIAEALDVPVSFFFDGLPDECVASDTGPATEKTHGREVLNIFSSVDIKAVEDEVRALALVYYLIESTTLRKGIIEFLKTVGREL